MMKQSKDLIKKRQYANKQERSQVQMEMNKELIAKAKKTKTTEELWAIAKENGAEMSKESAKAYFELLHPKSGEISDDELNNVSGGCNTEDGRKIVTVCHGCGKWKCKSCGGSFVGLGTCNGCGKIACCDTCCFCTYEKALWLCNYGH